MGNCCAGPSTARSLDSPGTTSMEIIGAEGKIVEEPNLKIFTFTELKHATSNFKPDTVIGEGGFGMVYKGWLDENTLTPTKNRRGMAVAIKKRSDSSMQGLEEWQATVKFLGKYMHPNIIKLLGCCSEDKELLLVYEFMEKGSLDKHLFKRDGDMQPLSWSLRLKVLLGAARGLAFLHSSEKQVIFRDFKSSSILIDSNYDSKLSDFGMARDGPTGEDSYVSTRVMGTLGYAAPEYISTGHLSTKSDVYGFGVVLLEIISGQRAFNSGRPNGQHNLVDWAKPYLSNRKKLNRIMDPHLGENYPMKGALQAAQLILSCVASNPKIRPSMGEAVRTLETIEAISNPKENTSG